MYLYKTLIALALALLIASCAAAQQAAYTPWPKRYDPARPYRYHRFYNHDSNRHGRHHPHWRHDHGRFDSHPDHHPRRDDGRRHRAGVRGSGPASGDRALQQPGKRVETRR